METVLRVSEVPAVPEQLAAGVGESDPWSTIRSGGRRWSGMTNYKVWRPPTDVYETDDSIVVQVEIAGLKEGDFEIFLGKRLLTIRGTRHESGGRLSYQQMEIRYGEFLTEAHLPLAVESNRTEASYENGFLLVRLPKTAKRRVTVVEVK